MTCPSRGILLNIQFYIVSEVVFIVTFIVVQDKKFMPCLLKPFFSDKSIELVETKKADVFHRLVS